MYLLYVHNVFNVLYVHNVFNVCSYDSKDNLCNKKEKWLHFSEYKVT